MPDLWRPGYELDLEMNKTRHFYFIHQKQEMLIVQKGTLLLHTLLKVFESFFTVTLLTITMQTLHSQAVQTHVAGQIISPENAYKHPLV